MKVIIIGTSLNDSLLSPASALKFDRVSPAPDMTKRERASKLITRGNWPLMRKAIINASISRSTTSQKELSLDIWMGNPDEVCNG